MKNSYKTYFAPAFNPSIDNFYNTKMYITWASDNYYGKEEIFDNIEAFALGEPINIDGMGKYIKCKYIGEINNIGIVEAYYDSGEGEFKIEFIKKIKGDNDFQKDNLEERLKACLLKQHKSYHNDDIDSWSNKIIWVYSEVKKVNAFKNNALYKEKENHNIVISFSESGDILSLKEKKYFKMYGNTYYDMKNRYLIRNNNTIVFSSQSGKDKQNFIDFLIENSNNYITKELLIKHLGYDKFKSEQNKALLDLKRALIEVELIGKLELKKEEIDDNILNSPRGGGYRIIGEFVSEIT